VPASSDSHLVFAKSLADDAGVRREPSPHSARFGLASDVLSDLLKLCAPTYGNMDRKSERRWWSGGRRIEGCVQSVEAAVQLVDRVFLPGCGQSDCLLDGREYQDAD